RNLSESGGAGMAGLPVVFKFTAAAIAAERDDGVGPAHRPKHPRALEATADDGFAARFDDSGTHEEMLPPKSGIAHAFGVGGKIIRFASRPFSRLGVGRGQRAQVAHQGFDPPAIQFLFLFSRPPSPVAVVSRPEL